MNRVTLLVLCVTLLMACKGNDRDTELDCTYWCPDFDGDGRGEFSTECDAYCYVDGIYPPDHGCRGTPYVANCDEVRPPFAE